MRKFILALCVCALVALPGCSGGGRSNARFAELKVIKVENVDRVRGRTTYSGTLVFDKEVATPDDVTYLFVADGKAEKKIKAWPLREINGKTTTKLFIQEDEKFINSLKDKRVSLLK